MLEYEYTGILPLINHIDSWVINIDTATPDTSNNTSLTTPTEETSNDMLSNNSSFNNTINIPLPISYPNTLMNPSSSSAPQPAPPKMECIRASSRVKKPLWALLESLQAYTVTLSQDPDQANFYKDLNKLPENILHALHTGMDSKKKEPTFAEAMNGSNAEK